MFAQGLTLVISSINRKLFRDFWYLRGQAFAIALVIAGGLASLVMSVSTLESLQLSQTSFYQRARFADVFASIKRAPDSLEARLRNLPGVNQLETRIVAPVRLRVAGFEQPISGKMISLPDSGHPLLNDLELFQGRTIRSDAPNEVVISEAFAEAHSLSPGDELSAIIDGRINSFTIVGTAVSPEYIVQTQPGTMIPDYQRYGIIWVNRRLLASAYGMSGAFNDLAMTLTPEANPKVIINLLDNALKPYGAFGAYDREDQISHQFLSSELDQLSVMATLLPTIFLGVAAFLFNIVISRIIALQREQIATLKAFGYGNYEIAWHYIKLVLIISTIGIAIGLLGGAYMGRGLSHLYSEYYRLPFLTYRLEWWLVAVAVIVSVTAACTGALFALYRVVRMAPAEAMRPEAPTNYRATWFERWQGWQLLGAPERMILRQLSRRPLKALLSIFGISFSCAIIILGSFGQDSVRRMLDIQFGHITQEDLTIVFTDLKPLRALYNLQQLPGVHTAEPFLYAAVELRSGHRKHRTSIQGFNPDSRLRPHLDSERRSTQLPPEGIAINQFLADKLHVSEGDTLTVEFLTGHKRVRQIPVALIIQEDYGTLGYMTLESLGRASSEGPRISGAWLAVDTEVLPALYQQLNDWPGISFSVTRHEILQSISDMLDEQILTFLVITTFLAGSIAFGVIYNSLRIAVSERARELASLRVLGYTQREVAYILFGEQTLLLLTAIPLGFFLGYQLAFFFVSSLQTDLFRMTLIVNQGTYTMAALVVLVSGVISAAIVWRRIQHLDMVAVLKTGD